MTARTVTCLECGARFRLPEVANLPVKIRCGKCKAIIPVGGGEKPASPKTSGKTPRKAKSGGGKALVILGVGFVVLLLLGGAGAAVVLFTMKPDLVAEVTKPRDTSPATKPAPTHPTPPDTRPKPPPPDVPAVDQARVTHDNFLKVKKGFRREEAEEVFGKGVPSSFEDILAAYTAAFGKVGGPTQASQIKFSAAKNFYHWPAKGAQVWIGYATDGKGVERVCTSLFVEEGKDKPKFTVGANTIGGQDVADKVGVEWDEEKRLFADPRFKRGEEADRLMVGEWCNETVSSHYRFGDGGQYMKQVDPFNEEKGTFSRTGPVEVQLRRPEGGVASNLKVLVGEDEMYIFSTLSPFDSFRQGPLYRVTPKGGNLGQQKVVDVLAAKARDGDVAKRRAGMAGLAKLGPCATPVVATVVAAVKDEDVTIRNLACHAVAGIGPPAKDAVPALIEIIKAKDVPFQAIVALGAIGPDAREALPRLKELQSGVDATSGQARVAVKQIEP